MSKTYKIFLSSTVKDLVAIRDRVDRVIRDLGHEPVRAESYGSQPISPREAVLQMVQESDILLGIYDSRYGFVPSNDKVSVIEMEFQAAKQSGKEILIYIAKAEDREPQMETFLRKIEDFDIGLFRRPYYSNIDQLTEWVKEDLLQLTQGRRFHLFTFKEYAKRLIEWTLKYRESSWSGRYTELTARPLDMLVYARRRGIGSTDSKYLSDIIDENQCALIAGEAGSGKTTSLLHSVKIEAERVLSSVAKRVPVFIALNGWTEDQDLESLILANLAALGKQIDSELLWTYMSEGRFMLAFDGVNEIPSSHRTKGAESDLATFVKRNYSNHIILTSRHVGYNPKNFQNWPIFEIQPLDRDSILNFATNYLGENLGKRLFQNLGGGDANQWQKPHSLINLARNPLLLWMLTETYSESGELPQDKGRLIRTFIDYILKTREKGKASNYSATAKIYLLRHLAFQMIESGEIVRTTEKNVLRVFSRCVQTLRREGLLNPRFTALDLLEEIRSNGLLHFGDDISIRWTHQLFQEFFGALELVDRFETHISISKQLNNADWKESAIMAASLSQDPEHYVNEVMYGWRGFIGTIFYENPRALLAIQCINGTYLWDNEKLRKYISKARKKIRRGLNQYIVQLAGTLMGGVGKPFSGLFVYLADLPFRSPYFILPVLWMLGETRETRALPILTSRLKSQDRVVRWMAADALKKIRDPRTVEDLIEALTDYDGDVQWVVIQALIYVGDNRAEPALVSLLNYPDPVIRWAACFALGKIGNISSEKNLELVRETDHQHVWWGEDVSAAAAIAVHEIQRRSQAGELLPEGAKDMLNSAMYKREII